MVGSTAAVDARDNTGTTYTNTDKGVPIYWLGGAKAADDYEDFYDGDWDDEVNDKNESGTDGPDTSVSTATTPPLAVTTTARRTSPGAAPAPSAPPSCALAGPTPPELSTRPSQQ